MAAVEAPRISIVLPAYDERDVIASVLAGIRRHAPPDAEIVVYDDGSRDGTSEILDGLAAEGWVRVVHGGVNRGFDAAVRGAMEAARGAIIHVTDSDGQHDPADLARLLAAMESDRADLVVGRKTPRRDPPGRLVLSAGLNAICRVAFRSRLHDVNCGFRVMTRELRDALLPRVGVLPTFISTEMALRAQAAGYRVAEVPVTHLPRASGKSRSLPLRRLPRILARLARGLVALRRELRSPRP